MKNFIEKTKDILYNVSDYIIIFGIIIGIAFIIGWRLDILFPETVATIEPNETVQSEKAESKLVEKPLPEVEDEDEDEKETDIESAPEAEVEAPIETETPTETEVPVENVKPTIIKVSIPDDKSINNIGNILLDLGLITSIEEFEEKVVELSFEKSFHSGEFDVQKDSSLEEVLKAIAE